MDEGDVPDSGLEAAEAARAEAEAAAEAERAGLDASEPARAAADRATSGGADEPAAFVCPFLRRARDGELVAPATEVDVDHRCAALPVAVPVSDAQQSLVCLVEAHGDCPRYLRGSDVVPDIDTTAPRTVPRPTIAAIGILAASLLATLAFTAANGGLGVPVPATPSPSVASVVTPSPIRRPSLAPTPTPATSAASPSPASSIEPSSPSSPSAPASPSPAASESPVPSPSATSDRYALLEPCPDRTDCYVYTVRAGDNLTSIGLYFGVPFDTILRLNPWIRDPTTIHKGERIVLPPPTR